MSLLLGMLLTTFVHAQDSLELERHSTVELARGICADPRMTDEERDLMISSSLENAVRCMGTEWVYSGVTLLQNIALGEMIVDANVSQNKVSVIDREGGLHIWLASYGRSGFSTLTGNFEGPYRVEDGNYVVRDKDKDYVGAPMPFAVFYKKDRGYAIHGVDAREARHLGRPASHGCIRVATENARWFNEQVRLANDSSVKINVHGHITVKHRPKPAPVPVQPNPDQPYDSAPYYPPTEPVQPYEDLPSSPFNSF